MLDTVKVEEQYELYKLRQQKKEKDETVLKTEKLKRQAEIQARITEANKPHKTRVPHKCGKCGQTIQAREYAQCHVTVTGYGYPEGYHRRTIYTHYPTCPAKEA
jgi:hypothetical protein